MSAYDDAVAYLDAEVHPRCDYDIYSDMRDIVDEMEKENAKLRDFAKLYLAAAGVDCDLCPYCDPELCDTETDPMRDGCRLWEEMHKLGVEDTDD